MTSMNQAAVPSVRSAVTYALGLVVLSFCLCVLSGSVIYAAYQYIGSTEQVVRLVLK